MRLLGPGSPSSQVLPELANPAWSPRWCDDGRSCSSVCQSRPGRLVRSTWQSARWRPAEYAGNFYGTPAGPVRQALAAGRSTLLEIEVQGARQIRAAMPDALLVMLVPPSWKVLDGRLSDRGTEDPAVRERRLRVAREELAAVGEFDATVINDNVQRAAEELITLMRWTVR